MEYVEPLVQNKTGQNVGSHWRHSILLDYETTCISHLEAQKKTIDLSKITDEHPLCSLVYFHFVFVCLNILLMKKDEFSSSKKLE